MKGNYVAVIHPRENGNGFECRVPDLPGCITSGKTIFEACEMIEDAANMWACDIEIDGREIPKATPYKKVERQPEDILQVVHIDTLSPDARPGSCNKHDTHLQGQWQSIWDEDITGGPCPYEDKLPLQLSQEAALKQLRLLSPDTKHS